MGRKRITSLLLLSTIRRVIFISPYFLKFLYKYNLFFSEFAKCSRYDFANSLWRDLPVAAVFAYDSDSEVLAGVSQSGTHVISHDFGFTWVEADDGSIADVRLNPTALTEHKPVPYSETECDSTGDDNYAQYGYQAVALAKYFSFKHSGIVYGDNYNANDMTNELYLWGYGTKWANCN